MKKIISVALFIFAFFAAFMITLYYPGQDKAPYTDLYVDLNTSGPSPVITEVPTLSPKATTAPTVSPQATASPASSPQIDDDKEDPPEIEGLIELVRIDDSFVLDIKYATEDNFTGKKIYTKSMCLIHKSTAKKLIAANNEFKKLGYRIKIFDAYRPFSAQQVLWDAAEDKSFVANPKKGSIHNRGAAVDVTLVDGEGNELEMPSGYDEFTKRARLDYKDCPKHQIENRELLGRIMVKHGFKRISNEWWHFEDTDAKNYPILDIAFEEF
ncbi:MAG: D-alanyl-D-alanine dipeptidase [Bacillota bacterium]